MSGSIICSCIIRSRVYGLTADESDSSGHRIFLPQAELRWSLERLPVRIEDDQRQEGFRELEKVPRLLLNTPPTILDCLHSPLIEIGTEHGSAGVIELSREVRDV